MTKQSEQRDPDEFPYYLPPAARGTTPAVWIMVMAVLIACFSILSLTMPSRLHPVSAQSSASVD